MIVRIRPSLDLRKVSKVLAAATGPDERPVKEFESAFASRLGASNAIAVDRGRAALLLALKILRIKKGDEVIVQSYIFHAVIDAILETGATPVLADSGLVDFNVAPAAIEGKITARTKAIMATHLGVPCDMDEISGIARKHDCYLIENCALTLGAEYGGRQTGMFGDISFFSFDVDKPISTGDGGMLVINNGSLLENARKTLAGYGRTPHAEEKEIICGLLLQHCVTREGIYPEECFLPVDFGKEAIRKDGRLLSLVEVAARNGAPDKFLGQVLPYLRQRNLLSESGSILDQIISRAKGRARAVFGKVNLPKIDSPRLLMNSLRGAVGSECLKDYDNCKAIRDRNAQYYIDHLDAAAFQHPLISEEKSPAFIRYAVLNKTGYENSFIVDAARKEGLEIGVFNWSQPIHLCRPYNRLLDFDRSGLGNSEYLGKRLLSLPVHPYVGEEGLEKIVHFMNGVARRR